MRDDTYIFVLLRIKEGEFGLSLFRCVKGGGVATGYPNTHSTALLGVNKPRRRRLQRGTWKHKMMGIRRIMICY